MLVKSLLKKCETGFDLVIIADRTSGHTYEYNSVTHALIDAGDNRLISWEVGVGEEIGRCLVTRKFVLYITI